MLDLLRSIIPGLFGRRRTPVTPAPMSKECSAPPTLAAITQMIDSASDEDDTDQINRAIDEYARAAASSAPPATNALISRFLKQLPDEDYEILRLHKQGATQSEIAALMMVDVEKVRESLTNTYFRIRCLLGPSTDDDGPGEPAPVVEESTLVVAAIERKVA